MLVNYNTYFNSLLNDVLGDYNSNQINDNIELEVPGFNKDNLEVILKGRYIDISGKTEKRKIYKRMYLPSNIDIENVTADIKDGILSIQIKEKEIENKNLLT